MEINWILILQWIFIIFLIFIVGMLILSQVVLRIIRKKYPFPIPGFLTRLIDNPIRRKFIQKPKKIADRMYLKRGMKVVEIGPGKGSYTKAVAEQILPGGIVYAIDIQESVIKKLKERIEKEGIKNVIPKIENAYEFSFKDETIDRIFAITCLPEIPDPVKVLKECKRILKLDGVISFSEFAMDPDYPFRKTEKRWAKNAGLKLKEEFGNWFVYQLNFEK